MTEEDKISMIGLDRALAIIASNLERTIQDTRELSSAQKTMAQETNDILKELAVTIKENEGLYLRLMEHSKRLDSARNDSFQIEKKIAVMELSIINTKAFNLRIVAAITTVFAAMSAYFFQLVSSGTHNG